jgi:hypothetical protein
MQPTQPLTQTAVASPWKDKEVSYGAKLGLTFVCALLLIILIVSLLVAIGVSVEIATGRTAPQNITSNLIAIGVAAALFVGSLVGLIVLWPYTRAATRFTPSYGAIAPTSIGHPFEVKFQRYLWGRSMRGSGTILFDSDTMTLAGHLEPNALFQFGIVLLITFLPLFLFGFGLGIIPALIIAYCVGRKNITRTITYSDVRDLQVKGGRVTFRCSEVPKQFSFAVAQVDGERLYRELLSRFPSALGGWMG